MSCCHVNVYFTTINHRFLGHPSKHAKPGQNIIDIRSMLYIIKKKTCNRF